MQKSFENFIDETYSQINSGLPLGRPCVSDKPINNREITIPFGRLTQHGLITGGTGTGKSRAAQLIIEQLIQKSVPVLLSDFKGDMSGFENKATDPLVQQRANLLKYSYSPSAYSSRFWGSAPGLLPIRMHLQQIDYVLISHLLSLNPTQESHLGAVYRYAKEHDIQLITLGHLKELCAYLSEYPSKGNGLSKSSLDVITRNIANIIDSGIDQFFGEPSFEISDLLDTTINILWLQNYQKEHFNIGNLMSLVLYKLYTDLPEIGTTSQPKLVIFIDEAHLLFKNSNKSLVDLMTSVFKQIRSKGVGIILSTQDPEDIPESIREQLGLKVQFALRSFGTSELKDMRSIVDSFPSSDYYNLREEVKSLDTGTCFVSVLNESGALLPPVKTFIYPPQSSSAAPSFDELLKQNDQKLLDKYKSRTAAASLSLGTPLDAVSFGGGGKWEMNQYLRNKQDQSVRRASNKRNKEIKQFMVIILAILLAVGFIMLMYMMLNLIKQTR